VKPSDFEAHCKEIGPWVNWENTTDVVLHGDPEIEVSSIAVTWLATDAVIEEAARLGCNFLISHEGIYYPTFKKHASEQQHHAAKQALLDEKGITVFRCHDTWDRMPSVGICDTWADFLGWDSSPRDTESYYKVCDVAGQSGTGVADQVLERIETLGQSSIQLMGDLDVDVSRLAIGTGAITRLPAMQELGADILLASDDGTHTTYCGLWSFDLGIPVIIVCHSTSELPGMIALSEYVPTIFPDVAVHYLPCGLPSTRTLT
jgi:putative NIF3 family GTP cyclohydrolase 1 type 2